MDPTLNFERSRAADISHDVGYGDQAAYPVSLEFGLKKSA
jgi:hypothetical protein